MSWWFNTRTLLVFYNNSLPIFLFKWQMGNWHFDNKKCPKLVVQWKKLKQDLSVKMNEIQEHE